jgi:hypothetical protein
MARGASRGRQRSQGRTQHLAEAHPVSIKPRKRSEHRLLVGQARHGELDLRTVQSKEVRRRR